MCQVIAITNQKGGVGKTTTTFHLGTKLAQEGKRVLLIDADPQASLTASFGIRDADTLNTTLTNALQAIVEDEPIDPEMGIRTHEEGAKLFPANIELASFETAMINVMSREYIMREFVNTHRPNFDYILIDCMPSLGMLTVNALAAADSVIIPSQPSFLSAKGLDLLLHSVANQCHRHEECAGKHRQDFRHRHARNRQLRSFRSEKPSCRSVSGGRNPCSRNGHGNHRTLSVEPAYDHRGRYAVDVRCLRLSQERYFQSRSDQNRP